MDDLPGFAPVDFGREDPGVERWLADDCDASSRASLPPPSVCGSEPPVERHRERAACRDRRVVRFAPTPAPTPAPHAWTADRSTVRLVVVAVACSLLVQLLVAPLTRFVTATPPRRRRAARRAAADMARLLRAVASPPAVGFSTRGHAAAGGGSRPRSLFLDGARYDLFGGG